MTGDLRGVNSGIVWVTEAVPHVGCEIELVSEMTDGGESREGSLGTAGDNAIAVEGPDFAVDCGFIIPGRGDIPDVGRLRLLAVTGGIGSKDRILRARCAAEVAASRAGGGVAKVRMTESGVFGGYIGVDAGCCVTFSGVEIEPEERKNRDSLRFVAGVASSIPSNTFPGLLGYCLKHCKR
jgi:hypothetical protein